MELPLCLPLQRVLYGSAAAAHLVLPRSLLGMQTQHSAGDAAAVAGNNNSNTHSFILMIGLLHLPIS